INAQTRLRVAVLEILNIFDSPTKLLFWLRFCAYVESRYAQADKILMRKLVVIRCKTSPTRLN
ncbi:MAG: hypothetical protein ACK5KM_02710, partial [Hyphomicrobiaceae bacterium]